MLISVKLSVVVYSSSCINRSHSSENSFPAA